jgi:hypothetical protein
MAGPSEAYRDNLLRACRAFRTPETRALLNGRYINTLTMAELVALYEVTVGSHPRALAPPGYAGKYR